MKRLIIGILISAALMSCTDADIVDGVYTGSIYINNDTLPATVSIAQMSSTQIKLETQYNTDITFVDFATLKKNNAEAYTFEMPDVLDTVGAFVLYGYYYEGYINFTSYGNNFWFEGNRND